jgi:hypothetical protein
MVYGIYFNSLRSKQIRLLSGRWFGWKDFFFLPKLLVTKMGKYSEDSSPVGPETVSISK